MRTIYRTSHAIPLYRLDGQYITFWEALQLANKDRAVIVPEIEQERFRELHDKHDVRKPDPDLDKVGGTA